MSDLTDAQLDEIVAEMSRTDDIHGKRVIVDRLSYLRWSDLTARLAAEVRRLRAAIAAVEAVRRDLREVIDDRGYDCRCQVGGVDAMSIDTDWLRRLTDDIAEALHPEEDQ